MCSEMHLQARFSFELFLADFTLMNRCLILLPDFLSKVDTPVVDGEVVVASEAFTTLLTLVSLLSRVYLLVLGEVIMPYEGLSTFVTFITLVIMVDTQVKSV